MGPTENDWRDGQPQVAMQRKLPSFLIVIIIFIPLIV